MSDAALFDALSAEFYGVWFRYHPERALSIGVRGYERLLPAQDDDDVGVLAAWLESLIVALEELDFAGLDPGRRLDMRLMFEEAQEEYEGLLERDWRHRDPLRFVPNKEIFRLTCSSGDGLRDAIAGVMQSIPEYLRHASGQLLPLAERIAPALVAATVEASEEGADYLRELADSGWLRSHCHGNRELKDLCNGAADALAEFAGRLQGEVVPLARGPLGCGLRQWQFLLRKRHGLRTEVADLRHFLSAEREATACNLADAARRLGVPASAAGVTEVLQRNTPLDGDARLQLYREECARLHDHLLRTGLAPLPQAPLRVLDRPPCPHPRGCSVGYAADYAAGSGVFVIGEGTPGEGRALIRQRCLDQGWAGAHLLGFAGGALGQRLPRRLSARESLAGGWGLYLRERLLAQGPTTEADRFLHLWHRWRQLCLAELDLTLHLDGMEERQLMEQLASLERDPHRRQALLVDLARRPTDRVAGAVGWRILERVGELWLASSGKDLTELHRRLFAEGALPLPLIVEHAFGPELWSQVRDGLLNQPSEVDGRAEGIALSGRA